MEQKDILILEKCQVRFRTSCSRFDRLVTPYPKRAFHFARHSNIFYACDRTHMICVTASILSRTIFVALIVGNKTIQTVY